MNSNLEKKDLREVLKPHSLPADVLKKIETIIMNEKKKSYMAGYDFAKQIMQSSKKELPNDNAA